MPLSEEFRQALNEIRTWARLHAAEHSVWQAIVTLDKAVAMAEREEAEHRG